MWCQWRTKRHHNIFKGDIKLGPVEKRRLIMNTTVTVTYSSSDSLRKAVDDLIGNGIPQEQFNVTKSYLKLKVITPSAIEPKIRELLDRHNPIKHGHGCKYCDYLSI
jgi:hypothetical protein